MKRLLSLLLVVILVIPSLSFAATKQDVINAINAHYQVGDTNFRLPQKYINRGEAYLNSHPLTSEQYDKILGCINAAVAYAREIGHVNYKQYTKEQINRGLQIIYAACQAAEVDLKEEMNKKDDEPTVTTKANSKQDTSVNITKDKQNTQSDLHNSNNNEEITNDNVIISGDTSGELTISGETQSGETIGDFTDINAFTEKIVYTEDDLDKEINQKIFIIYFVLFSILIINILLIRLIFKKKWNKILKVTLIILFVVVSLVLLSGICISLYYIEELKIIYKLYYLLY